MQLLRNYWRQEWRACDHLIEEGKPLRERSGAIIATCKDILDEPENLLGNDGRLGSFPDPAAVMFFCSYRSVDD